MTSDMLHLAGLKCLGDSNMYSLFVMNLHVYPSKLESQICPGAAPLSFIFFFSNFYMYCTEYRLLITPTFWTHKGPLELLDTLIIELVRVGNGLKCNKLSLNNKNTTN